MVAPIITFVIAAGVGFLTWKTSTIEPFTAAGQPPAADTATTSQDEPAAPEDEPAEDEE